MEVINFEAIEKMVFTISGQQVILDSDVAALYGVVTKRVNEAVKNNPEKFPDGYIVSLNKLEWDLLKSKYSTSIKGGKVKIPKAFTEKGLYMIATVLKSDQATVATIAIIETFAKIRSLVASMNRLPQSINEQEKKLVLSESGNILSEIIDDHLLIKGTETSIELNLFVLKIKHQINRK